MKRWIKWLLISGTLCCLVGAGAAAAGAAMGGGHHLGEKLWRAEVQDSGAGIQDSIVMVEFQKDKQEETGWT